MEIIEEHEGKSYLMVDDYMLDKVLDKTKEILGIKKFDFTEILIDTNDKLADEVTLINVDINYVRCKRW